MEAMDDTGVVMTPLMEYFRYLLVLLTPIYSDEWVDS